MVWHGADKLGVSNIDAYCDAWDTSQMHKIGLASSLTRGKLLDQERYSCNNAFIVLCIEVTSPEPPRARRRRRASDRPVRIAANKSIATSTNGTSTQAGNSSTKNNSDADDEPFRYITLLNDENELT